MLNKQILSNPYADLYFDERFSLLEEVWKPSTSMMNDTTYKAFQADKINATRKVKPHLFLCNTEHFYYTIVPEMQEWTDKVLNDFWREINLQKFAFVMSKGVFEQVSLEMVMQERSEHPYAVEYFASSEEARAWLLD